VRVRRWMRIGARRVMSGTPFEKPIAQENCLRKVALVVTDASNLGNLA